MSSLAVGFFDGVHLGHQAILTGATTALTFSTHPLAVLAPERAPRLLMSLDARVEAIRDCGVKEVRVLDFTRELAALSPADFAAQYLAGEIRCGENWRFGKGGAGDAAYLTAKGFAVTVVPYAEYKGEIVSSTRIRRALEAGEIADANAMMGRAFRVEGVVFAGKGEGRKLGYPTINLKSQISDFKPQVSDFKPQVSDFKPQVSDFKHQVSNFNHQASDFKQLISDIRLPYGVYEVEIAGQKAVANYGLAPTFGEKAWPEPVWELHLISTSTSSLHLTSTSFSLIRFLRPERKFDSVEDLKRQIAKDCAIIQS